MHPDVVAVLRYVKQRHHECDLLLISGSREYRDHALVARFVAFVRPRRGMHGGARGTDTWAHAAFEALGIPETIMRPVWRPGGKLDMAAGLKRNDEMLDERPALVGAFQAGGSRGTAYTVRAALNRNIPVALFDELGAVYYGDRDDLGRYALRLAKTAKLGVRPVAPAERV
jgi:hypothetical protein